MLLTTAQVASRLNVSVQTVLRRVKRGQLVAIKVGTKDYRFEPAEVARYLEERSSAVEAAS